MDAAIMDEQLKQWRAEGKHLPQPLRDFHDAKDVFRAMHEMTAWSEADIGGEITPVEGQCYVVDCFLWFMARHGYTLQKSRTGQNFESLQDNVQAVAKARAASFAKMASESKAAPAP